MKAKELRKIMSTGLIALTITASVFSAPVQYASAKTDFEESLEWGIIDEWDLENTVPYSGTTQYTFDYPCGIRDNENSLSEGYLEYLNNGSVIESGTDITNNIPYFNTIAKCKEGAASFFYRPGVMDNMKYNMPERSGQELRVTFTAPANTTLRVESTEQDGETTFVGLFDKSGEQIFSNTASYSGKIVINAREYEALGFPVQKGETYTISFFNVGDDLEAKYNMFFIDEAPKTTSKSKAIKEGKWYINTQNEWSFRRSPTLEGSLLRIPYEDTWKIDRADSIRITLDTKSKIKVSFYSPLVDRFDLEEALVCYLFWQKSILDNGNARTAVIDGGCSKRLDIGRNNVASYKLNSNGESSYTLTLPAGDYYMMTPHLGCLDLAYKYEVIEEYAPKLNKDWDSSLKVTSYKSGTKEIKGTAARGNTTVYCKYNGKTYSDKVDKYSGAFKIKTPKLMKGEKVKIWFVNETTWEKCSTKTITIK